MKKFKELDLKDQERIREIVSQKLSNAMRDIDEATGYYTELEFSILEDSVRKSMDIDVKIAMLARPHKICEEKVKHYLKYNPDNCLNEPILAFKYNNWYEIYNGVHRTEANRRLGKKTVKAKIIIADKEALEERNLN